jgi:hypothetical protein
MELANDEFPTPKVLRLAHNDDSAMSGSPLLPFAAHPSFECDFPAHYSVSACFPYAVVTMNVFGRRYRASTNGQLVAAESDPMRARVLKDIVMTGHNQVGDFVNLAQ